MGYNPGIHYRCSIRLTNYDYAQPGIYFITINIHIEDQQGKKLPEQYINVVLDAFQVMPNHIHGILLLTDVGVGLAPTRDTTCKRAGASPALTDFQNNPYSCASTLRMISPICSSFSANLFLSISMISRAPSL